MIADKELLVDDIITEWAKTISEDIAERRFYDKGEVAAYAKVKLATAISECIKVHRSDLLERRVELSKKYTDPSLSSYNKTAIANQLTDINLRIKTYNKLVSQEEISKRYYALKDMVRERFGQQIMDEHHSMVNIER